MFALAQYGKVGFLVLGMLLRWMVAKLDSYQKGSGVWVTGRTGNATVVTDKFF